MSSKYIAQRLSEFASYPFAKLSALRKEVAKTRRVIDMGVGDPDFPPPKELQGALVTSLGNVDTHRYPDYQGENYFRQAVARFFLNRYKVKLDADKNILCLIGSKEGIFHLPLAMLNSGEVAACTDPGYPVYYAGIVFAEGKPHKIPLERNKDFLFDLDRIPASTKLLWVNYPNNPTSAVASKEFWTSLVELAQRRGFLIANDAAYAEIYFDKPPISILEIPGAMDVAIEFHSLSKTFCITGWRVAFAVGNESAIGALAAVKRYTDSSVFRAIQRAGKTGLDNYWTLSEPIRNVFKKRVQTWLEVLTHKGIEAFNFGATFYVWAKAPARFKSSNEFSQVLLEKAGIVVLPGEAMGENGQGYIRFSLTLPNEDIEFAAGQLRSLAI